MAVETEMELMEKHHGEHCVEINIASYVNHARDDPRGNNSDRLQSSSAIKGAEMTQVKKPEV